MPMIMCKNIFLVLLITPWITCNLITPRTIPDDIDLFDSDEYDLDLVQSDKPWPFTVSFL